MSVGRSWIPGLEELGTAVKDTADVMEVEGGEQGRMTGKAAAAVIRSTNAKLAALEEECQRFRQLYEDLCEGVQRYAEAHENEAAAAKRADEEHREEMQSMVAAMSLLRRELERAAKDSAAGRTAVAEASADARAKGEAAEKFRQQYEAELKRRQELEMENIRMAREALAVPEKLRTLERECAALKQTVAILEEKCRLKEATFVDADNRVAKLQSELLEAHKKGLALESKLREETEEKLVVQRLLELERSRKVAKDGPHLRRDMSPVAAAVGRLTTPAERHKSPGNKQPSSHNALQSERSATNLRGATDTSQPTNRPPFKPSGMPLSPRKTVPPPSAVRPIPYDAPAVLHASAKPGAFTDAERLPLGNPHADVRDRIFSEDPAPGSSSAEPGDKHRPGDLASGALQREVERAVLEALRAAEERCDRAVAAAEARGKQALAQAELDRARAVRVATTDLETRLRREFAEEKRKIAEAAATEAIEAAVAAAVEEQESLHRQIEQLQSAVRRYKSGVRGEIETVRSASKSKAHVAAARRQAVLRRVPLLVKKDGKVGAGNGTEKGTEDGKNPEKGQSMAVSAGAHFEVRKGVGDEPVKQGARRKPEGYPGPSDELAVENERLRRALDECQAGRVALDVSLVPGFRNGHMWDPGRQAYIHSDGERWDSDGELSNHSLRAEVSDTVVGIQYRSGSIRDEVAPIGHRPVSIRDGRLSNRDGRAGLALEGRSDTQAGRSDRAPLRERAARRAEIRAAVVAGRGAMYRAHSPPQKGTSFQTG